MSDIEVVGAGHTRVYTYTSPPSLCRVDNQSACHVSFCTHRGLVRPCRLQLSCADTMPDWTLGRRVRRSRVAMSARLGHPVRAALARGHLSTGAPAPTSRWLCTQKPVPTILDMGTNVPVFWVPHVPIYLGSEQMTFVWENVFEIIAQFDLNSCSIVFSAENGGWIYEKKKKLEKTPGRTLRRLDSVPLGTLAHRISKGCVPNVRLARARSHISTVSNRGGVPGSSDRFRPGPPPDRGYPRLYRAGPASCWMARSAEGKPCWFFGTSRHWWGLWIAGC